MELATRAYSPCKWVGGKSRLLPEIQKYVPQEYGTYFEPFIGGGAVFFYLEHPRSHISDANEDLINLYQVIRTDVEALIAKLQPMKYKEDVYYEIRAQIAVELKPVDRAARMLYLNKTGFNGLYRVNKLGQFNVPFGRHTNPRICDEVNLRECAKALAATTIQCCDFEKTLSLAQAGDFLYADPPYVPLSATADFTAYGADGFGPKEQERLMNALLEASNRGAYVLASNSDTPAVRELYEGWNLKQVFVGRTVSAGADRGKVAELLISNY